jgi:hypothetical protein
MASVAGLCCRGGWTRRLIDRLLGEPDKLARNPHYASAAPMRLYLLERVAEVEQTPEYQRALAKLGPRREVMIPVTLTALMVPMTKRLLSALTAGWQGWKLWGMKLWGMKLWGMKL